MTNVPTTRETADHAELAACPFCGGDPFDCGFRRWECGLCGAKGPAGQKNDATSGWNSRAGEAALLSEIAALRGERDRLKLAICGSEDVPGAIDAVTVDDCEGFIREERQRHDGLLTQAERQRDELRKALEPFADEFGAGIPRPDDFQIVGNLNLGHFRRATDALANQGADQ